MWMRRRLVVLEALKGTRLGQPWRRLLVLLVLALVLERLVVMLLLVRVDRSQVGRRRRRGSRGGIGRAREGHLLVGRICRAHGHSAPREWSSLATRHGGDGGSNGACQARTMSSPRARGQRAGGRARAAGYICGKTEGWGPRCVEE